MFVFLCWVTPWPYSHTSNAAQSFFYPQGAGLLSWGYYIRASTISLLDGVQWWAMGASFFSLSSPVLACSIFLRFILPLNKSLLQFESQIYILIYIIYYLWFESLQHRCELNINSIAIYTSSERSIDFSGELRSCSHHLQFWIHRDRNNFEFYQESLFFL